MVCPETETSEELMEPTEIPRRRGVSTRSTHALCVGEIMREVTIYNMENSRLRSDSVMELASSYVMDNGNLHLKVVRCDSG